MGAAGIAARYTILCAGRKQSPGIKKPPRRRAGAAKKARLLRAAQFSQYQIHAARRPDHADPAARVPVKISAGAPLPHRVQAHNIEF